MWSSSIDSNVSLATRDSIFKRAYRDRYLITAITLRLSTQPRVNITYPALAEVLTAAAPTPQLVGQAVCRIRQQKLPDPEVLPNAGSFLRTLLSASRFSQVCIAMAATRHIIGR